MAARKVVNDFPAKGLQIMVVVSFSSAGDRLDPERIRGFFANLATIGWRSFEGAANVASVRSGFKTNLTLKRSLGTCR